MIASELHPIGSNSVITEAMLDVWCKAYDIADEESQRPGVLGSLNLLEGGVGVFPQALLDNEEIAAVFAPLHEAYSASHVEEAAEEVAEEAPVVEEAPAEEVEAVEEVAVEVTEEVTEAEGEKLPVSEESAT